MDRIKAVAADAEAERNKEVEERRRKVQEFYDRTGKKRKVDYESIKGGAAAVNGLLAPTVRAIGVAKKEYERALREQGGDVNGV